jgi:AbrB family looped-hinge helix DNA binding protein
VTLPKDVREAANIQAGDRVEVRATASGAVIIEKSKAMSAYEATLRGMAKQRLIRGITTDELMEMTRGEGPASLRKR